MDQSVFVIDPGHGCPDWGGVGPNGLAESEVNVDVSARILDLLWSAS
jgi:N-acetylmuramoyl-L-alanine amidase